MSPHDNNLASSLMLSSRTFVYRFVKSRGRALLYAGWAIAIGVFLVLAADSLIVAPRKDLSAFIYVAQGIPDGQMPYVDRWDNKGPMTYLLTLIGISISDTLGIWLLGVTFLAGSTWLAFKTTKEAFGATAGLISCTLFLVSFTRLADGGGLTEHYAMLFQFAALFLFIQIGQRSQRHDVLLCLSIGTLGAAAFLLKANLVGVWLAIGAYWIAQPYKEMRRVLWAIAGRVGCPYLCYPCPDSRGHVGRVLECCGRVQFRILRCIPLEPTRRLEGSKRRDANIVLATGRRLVRRSLLPAWGTSARTGVQRPVIASLDPLPYRTGASNSLRISVQPLLSCTTPFLHPSNSISCMVRRRSTSCSPSVPYDRPAILSDLLLCPQ